MKKYLLTILIATGIHPVGVSQANSNYLHTRNVLERLSTRSFGITSAGVPTLPMAAPEVKGDVYLTPTFNLSLFQLYDSDQLVEGFYAKLDIQKNEFDLMTKQGVRVLAGKKVKAFACLDSLTQKKSNFINAREWKWEQDVPLEGFLKILSDGQLLLVKRTEVIFRKADYNAALNVGSRDHKYLKKDHLYYISGDIIRKLPGKKDFTKIFGDRKEEMDKYIRTNQLNIHKESDLITLFNYFNGVP
jgi:hypothetical protein